MKSIGFFPAIGDTAAQEELLARATWYLWPWRARIKSARFWGPSPPAQIDAAALGLDPSISAQYADMRAFLDVKSGDDNAASAALTDEPCDLLFIWKTPRTDQEQALCERAERACRARGGVVQVVDPQASMNEGSLYLWGCLNVLGDEAEHVDACKQKFEALKARARSPRVYIFGTGPSLDLLSGHDFSDADSIVCNSIVANEALLNRTNPIAIVAGDPIFHAGCSQYAADFRAKLRHVLEARDIYFVTVMRDYVQQLAQLPPHLHDKVIGIPFLPDDSPFTFGLDRDFRIAPEGNVLSLLLFPLAAALYERITVCGCDGRALSENTYFWSHDKASQLATDKMANIQRVHPAFFARSYDDHYAEHVAAVGRIVDILEEAGKRVDVLTPSHIPTLGARQCGETASLIDKNAAFGRRILLVSVNPDAVDDYGHWVWYDRRLSEQAKQRGVDFISLANKRLHQDILVREGHFLPVFEYETWGAGNQAIRDIDLNRLIDFEQGLVRETNTLRESFPEHERVYYAYTGSLPHALAMYRLARDNPDDFFVINTFWTCVMDCLAEDYLGRWGEFLRQAQALPNLRIFSITPQLKTMLREHTGVSLNELPHPTPSLPGPRVATPRRHGTFRVLFPGGMTEQKGFSDIPAILEQVRAQSSLDQVELMVRATDTEGTLGEERRQIIQRIEAHAITVNKVMDDVEFLGWLSSADVAILPYRREQWVYRNSALLLDLLYLGVPVICARGTWLSDVVERLGGGITVDADDPSAYALAIETILMNRMRYAADAMRAAYRYDAANSWTVLTDSVLAILNTPAARRRPPAVAAADEAAPINWWRPEDKTGSEAAVEETRAYDEPEAAHLTSAPAACASETGQPASLKEAAAFAFHQLTRSRIAIAGWTLALASLIFSQSRLSFFEPIRTHLITIAAAGGAAVAAFIALRYFHHHRRDLLARLSGKPQLITDIVVSFGSAFASRGIMARSVLLLTAIWGLVWLSTYGLRLNGAASQATFDLIFWGGLVGCALAAGSAIGLRVLLHAGRRILIRNNERILAQAQQEAEKKRAAADAASATHFAVLSRRLSAKDDSIDRMTKALAQFNGFNLRLNALTAAVARIIQEKSRAGGAATERLLEQLSADVADLREAAAALAADMGGLDERERAAALSIDAINHQSLALQEHFAEVSRHISALQEVHAVLQNQQEEIAQLSERLAETSDRISTLQDAQATLQTRHDEEAERGAALRESFAAVESSNFHVAPRYIPQDSLTRLAERLSKAFEINLNARALGYASHRIRQLEARCQGRIAAPMSDILVRTAALMAVKRKSASVLEIGSLFGIGPLAMYDVCRNRFDRLKLSFLDPLSGYYGGDYGPPLADLWTGVPVTRDTLEHNIRVAGVPPEDIAILQFYSEDPDALERASAERFDLLIIDGDHSFDAVMRDFTDYGPLVRKNGFIIFDDYEVPEWSGVTDAVNKILDNEEANLQKVFLDGKTLVCRIRGKLTEAGVHGTRASVNRAAVS